MDRNDKLTFNGLQDELKEARARVKTVEAQIKVLEQKRRLIYDSEWCDKCGLLMLQRDNEGIACDGPCACEDLEETAFKLAKAELAIEKTLELADFLVEVAAHGGGFDVHWGERVAQTVEPLRNIEITANDTLKHNKLLLKSNGEFIAKKEAAEAALNACVVALETLAGVDIIACEDTRITRRLTERYAISAQLKPYHDHNAEAARPKILLWLADGASVALV